MSRLETLGRLVSRSRPERPYNASYSDMGRLTELDSMCSATRTRYYTAIHDTVKLEGLHSSPSLMPEDCGAT